MEKRLIDWGKIIKIELSAALHPDQKSDIEIPPDTAPSVKTDETGNTGGDNNVDGDRGEAVNDGGKNECKTDESENETGYVDEEGAETPQNDAESAAANPTDGTADNEAEKNVKDLPDMISPVCLKVCGSKSALTSHMKTHTA